MTEDLTAPSDRQSNGAYLLLHPEDLEGLVEMEEAIDAIEKAYGEAATWPMVNAPRRRIHSPDGVRFSCFPGGVPGLGVIGVVEHAERVVQDGPIQHTRDLEHQICVLHDSKDSRLLAVLLGSIPERLVGYTARTALRHRGGGHRHRHGRLPCRQGPGPGPLARPSAHRGAISPRNQEGAAGCPSWALTHPGNLRLYLSQGNTKTVPWHK